MTKKLIAEGAEAVIYELNGKIVKERIEKSYRIKYIDKKLREKRTKSEKRIIKRVSKIINVPSIFESNDKTKIIMSKVIGKKLSLFLNDYEEEFKEKIAFEIGKSVALLHDNDIIHGDLTTSNMIYSFKEDKLYFIDFGLSFISKRIEDKAVDIHLFKQALESKHFKSFDLLLKNFFEGYKSSINYDKVLKQLEKVEKRGRYKH